MRKEWKYRLSCGFLALAMAGIEPTWIYAEQNHVSESQESVSEEESAAQSQESSSEEEGAAQSQESSSEEESAAQSQEPSSSTEGALQEQEFFAEGENLLTTDEQIDAYFDGAVFVGDSVMVGYSNYAMRRGGPFLGRLQFLSAVSFSAFNALRPVTAKSTHPLYQGQKRYIWESLAMMQAKKVFICFGLNDIDMGPLERTGERYAQVIANIKSTCPEAEIHIMSMTYMRSARAKGRLNNPSIAQFNEMMRQMALNNGWGFVDIANPLADASGQLASQYCSDNYVHQTNAAYDVWSQVLREYAKSQLEGTSAYTVGGEKTPEEDVPEESQEKTAEEQETPSEQETDETQGSRVIGPKENRNQGGPGVPKESEESTEMAES